MFPLAVLLLDALRGRPRVHLGGLPLLALGYGLYRYAAAYRASAGPRGFDRPPRRLVVDGPYALSRNPMYLGHLLFMAGLVLATRSPLALALALRQARRFSERVRLDEDRLAALFGEAYEAYRRRTPRWLPLP